MSFIKKLLLILGIFSAVLLVEFAYHVPFRSPYSGIVRNPYYTSPKIQKVNPNNINIIAPHLNKYTGETFIVRDLVQFFRGQGKNVKVFDPVTYTDKENFDYYGRSVNIYLYGYEPFYPNKSGINIIYLLYPALPSIFYDDFDLLAVTSQKYAEDLSNQGFKTTYIPQGTNPLVFKYDPQFDDINLLFVGHPKRYKVDFRPSVKYAVQNNFPIDIYGKGWESYIPKGFVKGEYIPNDELYRYYSSAKITLNDHRQDMLGRGFISNRIPDVTACKGFIISDYVPEIEEIYGDSVPMWRNAAEFKEIVNYYLNHPEERAEKAQKAHEITMKNFTIDIIGKRFLEEIDKLVRERQAIDKKD